MKQTLIVRQDAEGFKRDVNDKLENGWKVVPGTLVISGSPMALNGAAGYSTLPPVFYFAIVLEV